MHFDDKHRKIDKRIAISVYGDFLHMLTFLHMYLQEKLFPDFVVSINRCTIISRWIFMGDKSHRNHMMTSSIPTIEYQTVCLYVYLLDLPNN